MNATVPEQEEYLPTDAPETGEIAGGAQEMPAEPEGEQKSPEDAPEAAAADEPPLAWHRFLTNFGLWLAALYHGAQAGWLLLGKQYYTAEIRETVYVGLPKLRMLDWVLAGVAAVAALLCVLSAVKLRKRRSAGPRLLCWTYVLLLVGQLGFAAGRWFIVGLTPLSVSTLGPVAVYLALLLVNGSYYRRRRGCFSPLNQTEGH